LAKANSQPLEGHDNEYGSEQEIPKNEVEIGFVTEELIREISEGGELDDVTTDKILNIFENHIATYYTLNGSSEIGDYSAQHEDEVQERIDAALVGMAPESDLQGRIDPALVGMVPEDEVQTQIDAAVDAAAVGMAGQGSASSLEGQCSEAGWVSKAIVRGNKVIISEIAGLNSKVGCQMTLKNLIVPKCDNWFGVFER
jgi:hypothetical protein